MTEQGKFILIEGQGMSGKSNQAALLVNRLKDFGISAVATKHPGGIPSTVVLANELKRRKAEEPDFPAEEQFDLMARSLDLLQEEVTRPALLRGDWVVQDRSWPTVEVYQGYEAGFPLNTIREFKARALKPDLNIFLTVSPVEIIKRTNFAVQEAGREIHAFNTTDLTPLTIRHEGYLTVATRDKSENWQIINGVGLMEEVNERIWQVVTPLLTINQ